MTLIGSAPGIFLTSGSGGSDPSFGVLYAFDDAIVAAWFQGSVGQRVFGLRAEKSPKLQELDTLPQSAVTIEEVARRSSRGAWIFPTEDIASAVLARSKFVGAAVGISVIKITSRHDEAKAFYARRYATKSLAELLVDALGDRFENRRINQRGRT
jgi:hypothetical protein